MASHTESTPAWVSEFQRALAIRGVADMGGNHLSVLSDFSGNGKYQTLSFLIFAPERSPDWPRLRHELRQHFPDNRRIKFSNLNPSSHLYKHLHSFLSIADMLDGWCFTIAVHDDIRALVTDDHSLELWTGIANLQGGWKPRQFENVLRIVHFLALLLSRVIGDTRSIEWVSDQDDIFANDARCQDVVELLRISLRSYAPSACARIVVGTSEIDTGHRGIEDLLSINDLSAGAVGEALSTRYNDCDLSGKSATICDWLAQSDGALSKCTIEFGPEEENSFSVRGMDLDLRTIGR